MNILLLGGVQGVGKSTTLALLKKQLGTRARMIDPGELFRRYFYKKRRKTIEQIEEMVVQKILATPTDMIALVHWHYAVPRRGKYITQISVTRLKHLVTDARIEQVMLGLLKAPPAVIHERRKADHCFKKRSLSKKKLGEEIQMENKFFSRQKKIITTAIGTKKVFSFTINTLL